MDNIRDRGNIKWVSMMLTEHREMLHRWGESQEEAECPRLTEDELAELSVPIGQSLQEGVNIRIHYYCAKQYHEAIGIVRRFDSSSQMIDLAGQDVGMIRIPVRHIVRAVTEGES